MDSLNWHMQVDIHEDENQIVIYANVPCMGQKNIKVNVDYCQLTISGEHKFDDEKNKENYNRIERAFGKSSRSLSLPNTTDARNIPASYTDGLLEVILPKLEKAKPHSIQIKVN
ncbi:MAG: Hsp20/alpha crystallin family protein [Magnetococcales bacterium]|nr:Hsp20/alpha crystallin family protein [Magnetococcales bacterium]